VGAADFSVEAALEGRTGASSIHKCTVTFNVNINNTINHTNLGPYNGALISRFFGLANRALQPRRIELGYEIQLLGRVREIAK